MIDNDNFRARPIGFFDQGTPVRVIRRNKPLELAVVCEIAEKAKVKPEGLSPHVVIKKAQYENSVIDVTGTLPEFFLRPGRLSLDGNTLARALSEGERQKYGFSS